MAHTVFISYSDNDKDRKIARAICSTLESRGIHCWMAPRDIIPGKHYAEAIVDAINSAQVVVLVLSSSANSSPQVLREVERASSRDIPIVTFRVEDVALKKALEYFLSSYHWLDATNIPLEDSSKQLVETIERLILPPEEQLPAEKKREATLAVKPVAAEKKAHPVWFWLGLLLFVVELGVMISLFMIHLGSGAYEGQDWGILAWNLPLVFAGIVLIWLSRKKIDPPWFWPGAVLFTYGLTASPTWINNLYNYDWHSPYPGEFALTIGGLSFPFIVAGAFCLWWGWPRTGSKHPRREWLSFTTVFCVLCLVSTLTLASLVSDEDILSFSDNFQDGNADGWQLEPGGWQVVNENGNHVLSCQSQNYLRARPRVTLASDYALSADFKLIKGSFEFQFRKLGTRSYNVLIWGNRISLTKVTSDINNVGLGSVDMDIGTNQWHKIEISLNGGNIKIYIDNSLKIDYQDENPLPSGSFLIQNHPDSGVELDNIVVKPSSIPAPTPTPTPTSVSPVTPVPSVSVVAAEVLGTYQVGEGPYSLCIEGNDVWVANYRSHNVTKLSITTGKILATVPVGNRPCAVTFDGANIWVANWGDGSLTKIRAIDGMVLATYNVGGGPCALACDGDGGIWVTRESGDTLIKLRSSDGQMERTMFIGDKPVSVIYDGTNLWVANFNDHEVKKVNAKDGAIISSYDVGHNPVALASDGENIWVVNQTSNNLMKLRASDGEILGTFAVGTYPVAITFDGTYVWVVNQYSDNVTLFKASDGAALGTCQVGRFPSNIAFDGFNVWVANSYDNNIMELRSTEGG